MKERELYEGTYREVITAAGKTEGFNVGEVGKVVIHASGTWAGNMSCQTSNNTVDWLELPVRSAGDEEGQSVISTNGVYVSEDHGKYLRFDVRNFSGTLIVTAVGRI